MRDIETPNLDAILKEIQVLKKSNDLLEEVHSAIGPYGRGQIPAELRYKINDHFGFDDSE